MLIKILVGLVIALVIFLGYVSTRSGQFRYERSGLISASPAQIFPYLSDFRRGGEWSPYEKKDPNLKRNFKGPEAQIGSVMEFDGNSDAGAGSLEIIQIVPNELVHIRLLMTKPITAEHLVEYRLTPEGGATRFSWAMSGDGGFLGKLMTTLIDCEALVAKDMVIGIENLKTLIEGKH